MLCLGLPHSRQPHPTKAVLGCPRGHTPCPFLPPPSLQTVLLHWLPVSPPPFSLASILLWPLWLPPKDRPVGRHFRAATASIYTLSSSCSLSLLPLPTTPAGSGASAKPSALPRYPLGIAGPSSAQSLQLFPTFPIVLRPLACPVHLRTSKWTIWLASWRN